MWKHAAPCEFCEEGTVKCQKTGRASPDDKVRTATRTGNSFCPYHLSLVMTCGCGNRTSTVCISREREVAVRWVPTLPFCLTMRSFYCCGESKYTPTWINSRDMRLNNWNIVGSDVFFWGHEFLKGWRIWGSHSTTKSTIFWDITPCNSLKVNRRFGGTYCFYLHAEEPASSAGFPPAFTLVSCSAYSTLKMEATRSSETSVNFQCTTWRYILGAGTLLMSCR
jgi:hypothetical protein